MTLSGDKQPSDEEVEAIAKENKVELMPADESSTSDDTSIKSAPNAEARRQSTPEPSTEESTPKRGIIGRTWDKLNEPLTDLPSRVASRVADTIDAPSVDRSPFAAQVEGFLGGATEGLGDLLSGFTSPINLATTLATAGSSTAAKAGLPTIAKGLEMGARAASIPMAISGGEKVINPNSTLQQRGQGLTEIAMAGLGARGGHTATPEPVIDPNIEWGAKPPVKETGMGQPTPRLSPEVEAAKPIGHKSTDAANTINQNAAEAAAAEKAKSAPYVDPYAKYRNAKVGTTFQFDKMSRKDLDNYIKLGYNYKEYANGKIILEKVKDSPSVKEWIPPEEKESKLADAFNAPRTIMASADFSAPLRQGIGLIHKKEFWTSLDDMFKAWGSEKAYNEIQNSITENPLFKKQIKADGSILPSMAEESGLKLTDLNSMSSREESMRSTWAEKLPLVRRSNRAYTAFLNKLRADTFANLVENSKDLGLKPKENLALTKAYAEFVNTATGRGSLGKLEQSADALSSVLFSPRLIASRLQMLNPQYYWALPGPARKEALKSLLAVAAAGNLVTGLGRLAGGTVEMDPASADFGKLRLGNTRIDPYAGFQQYIVAAQRLMPQLDELGIPIGGRMKSTNTGIEYDLSNPKYGQSDRFDVLERLIRSKTNPVISFAWGLLRNKRELSGEKMNFTTMNPMDNAVSQRFIPLLVQDMYDLIKEEGLSPKTMVTAPLATLGMGVQEYKPQRPH